MAATAGGEPDAAAGSEPATAGQKTAAATAAESEQTSADAGGETTAAATAAASGQKTADASGETTAAATAAAWDEPPAAAADQTTVAATAAASGQTTPDESVAGGQTTAAATPAAAGGTTAAANSSSKGIRNMKLDKPTRPSDETTSAASSQGAALDDAKPWWEGLKWWEIETKQREWWLHRLGLDELKEKQETTAAAYEETWYKAQAAENSLAWYDKRCRHLENEIDELHRFKEKTKKETDKKLEQMQKKFEQMEKMIEHKFNQERGKRRELELMVARVFEDLQHKVAWLMVQISGWSSWKPWTTPSLPGLP